MSPKSMAQLVAKFKRTPYLEAINHVLLMNSFISKRPQMDFSEFSSRYAAYTDEAIANMELIYSVDSKEDLKIAISNVKQFLNQKVGPIAYSNPEVFGSGNGFSNFVLQNRQGFEDWADVLADLEYEISKLD
ncbi:hypothetical protein HY989_04830 [Candidatus Micrarchaeota archaeon]|nr:hypothetical protein [Candidatus Micrarchaeota archaeon]